jgi:hypothetical protein
VTRPELQAFAVSFAKVEAEYYDAQAAHAERPTEESRERVRLARLALEACEGMAGEACRESGRKAPRLPQYGRGPR